MAVAGYLIAVTAEPVTLIVHSYTGGPALPRTGVVRRARADRLGDPDPSRRCRSACGPPPFLT
ncbi:MAG TPA: hypothetical protein VGJ45_33975 [Pseudonocardiaceae bacterium]